MSKFYALMTIGNRDVKLGEDSIEEPFSEGKKILENWEKHKEKIKLPLIEPFFKKILSEIKYDMKIPNIALKDFQHFFIFVTDQENAEDKFRKKDTLYFGEIIKRLLIERWQVNENKISLIKIKDVNNIKALNRLVKRNVENQLGGNKEKIVYAEISGGIPFINYAITFRLTYKLRDKFRVFNIEEDKNIARDKGFVDEIIKFLETESIKKLIEKYQYFACKEFNLEEKENDIFEFLNALKNMDLEKAKHFQEKVCEKEGDRFKILCGLNFPDNTKDYLRFLYYNMEIKVASGEFIDFLGRLYSFRENILKLFLNKFVNYPLNADNHIEAHNKFLNENTEIKEYLKTLKFGKKELNYEEPNRVVFLEILKYVAETNEEAKEALTLLNKFNEILDYRNKTIIGHEFKGCSIERVNEMYEGGIESLFKDLRKLLKMVGFSDDLKNFFDTINQEVIPYYEKKS